MAVCCGNGIGQLDVLAKIFYSIHAGQLQTCEAR